MIHRKDGRAFPWWKARDACQLPERPDRDRIRRRAGGGARAVPALFALNAAVLAGMAWRLVA
jgi:hypothetical protein